MMQLYTPKKFQIFNIKQLSAIEELLALLTLLKMNPAWKLKGSEVMEAILLGKGRGILLSMHCKKFPQETIQPSKLSLCQNKC